MAAVPYLPLRGRDTHLAALDRHLAGAASGTSAVTIIEGGAGLGKTAGKVFRIGHLGDFNDLMLAGTLAGVEMGLELAGIPHRKGGINAALDYLTEQGRAAA